MSSISASVSSASPFQSQSASRKPKCKNCNKVGHDAASCWSSSAKAAPAGGGGTRNISKRGRQSGNRRTKKKTYKRTTGGTPNAANTAKRALRQVGPPANSNVKCFNCGGFGHLQRNCASRSSQAQPRKTFTTNTSNRNKPPPSKCTGCNRAGHTRAQCERCWTCGKWQHTKRTCPKKS